MAPSDDLVAKHREVQAAAKSVLSQLGSLITPADSERTISEKAYRLLCEHGFPNTWYYDCPAFVLAGTRSCLSISGRDYKPSEELVGSTNLVSIDLSPERNGYWGDCARSFYIENGAVVEPTLGEFTVVKKFLDAEDAEIFEVAKAQNIIFITKDSDFVDLVNRFGQPPKIILLTCGNTSNDRLKEILSSKLLEALDLLNSGEPLVEISGN